mmetsp:Transcript_115874/g.310663  ORF Transcript_115874/g.310663 Transcript_115874/m.310663 type:complete len:248 (+) Transcript_115874:318-1061(+)
MSAGGERGLGLPPARPLPAQRLPPDLRADALVRVRPHGSLSRLEQQRVRPPGRRSPPRGRAWTVHRASPAAVLVVLAQGSRGCSPRRHCARGGPVDDRAPPAEPLRGSAPALPLLRPAGLRRHVPHAGAVRQRAARAGDGRARRGSGRPGAPVRGGATPGARGRLQRAAGRPSAQPAGGLGGPGPDCARTPARGRVHSLGGGGRFPSAAPAERLSGGPRRRARVHHQVLARRRREPVRRHAGLHLCG